MGKTEFDIIAMIQEYIYNLCETKNIPIDLRFACLGDVNEFCTNENRLFSLNCVSYYADNIEGVKQFFSDGLDQLWRNGEYPYNRVALYIKDIVDTNGQYEIIVGVALFMDDSLF